VAKPKPVCGIFIALCIASGCAATPDPATPDTCPLRQERAIREKVIEGLGSLLGVIATYETIARMTNRADLLALTDRARRKLEDIRAQIRDGQPFDQEALWSAVRDLEDFERRLYEREETTPLVKPVIRYL